MNDSRSVTIENIKILKVENDDIVISVSNVDDYIPPDILRKLKTFINKKGRMIFIPDKV